MFTFLTILIIIVSVLITLIVLIQNPKGGGLMGGLGTTTSNIIGVQSAGDVMEKTTWGATILLFALCVLTAFVVPKTGNAAKAKTLTEQAAKMQVPTVPQSTPSSTSPLKQNTQPESK